LIDFFSFLQHSATSGEAKILSLRSTKKMALLLLLVVVTVQY